MTAFASAALLALVIWMDAADLSAESAAWIMAGVLGALAIVYVGAWAWRQAT
jgi:hypothetical protein